MPPGDSHACGPSRPPGAVECRRPPRAHWHADSHTGGDSASAAASQRTRLIVGKNNCRGARFPALGKKSARSTERATLGLGSPWTHRPSLGAHLQENTSPAQHVRLRTPVGGSERAIELNGNR
jgi:hypothetical protein